jgi:hypothetical protein
MQTIKLNKIIILAVGGGGLLTISPRLNQACAFFACRTLAKPYSKHSSAEELKLISILGGLLYTLTAVLQPNMPQQLQECTAEVRDCTNQQHAGWF